MRQYLAKHSEECLKQREVIHREVCGHYRDFFLNPAASDLGQQLWRWGADSYEVTAATEHPWVRELNKHLQRSRIQQTAGHQQPCPQGLRRTLPLLRSRPVSLCLGVSCPSPPLLFWDTLMDSCSRPLSSYQHRTGQKGTILFQDSSAAVMTQKWTRPHLVA